MLLVQAPLHSHDQRLLLVKTRFVFLKFVKVKLLKQVLGSKHHSHSHNLPSLLIVHEIT